MPSLDGAKNERVAVCGQLTDALPNVGATALEDGAQVFLPVTIDTNGSFPPRADRHPRCGDDVLATSRAAETVAAVLDDSLRGRPATLRTPQLFRL